MSSNKVIFEQPGGNTGVNHDHPTAALHITQEHTHATQPILKLESPDPKITFIDSTNPGKDFNMYWNGAPGHIGFKWYTDDFDNPEMVLSKEGVLGVGVHSFTGVQDGSPSVLSDILEPKIYTDGSIQITNGTGAFVVGTGSGSFLRDEELGFGWGGGWYMTDNTYLRVRNNKHVYSTGGATFTGVTSNSNIQINSTTPVLVMKDTNATSAQTHNSFISFKSSDDSEKAWLGFGSVTDNKFRIVNKWETPVHIHGSCAGSEPLSTLIVQDNSDSNHAGILIAGHSNKQTHLRFQHGDDLMWQWRVPMHSSSNGDSMRLYSWTAGGDVLTIDNGGNVGIGTAYPSDGLLHLKQTGNDAIRLERYDSGVNNGNIYFGHTGAGFGVSTSGKIGVTSPDLFISSTGNVGIGTLSPGATLDVVGNGLSTTPTLSLKSLSSNVFNHSINAFNSNLTTGQSQLIMVGKEGSTKNSGYIGYKWDGNASDSNILTFGHWAADYLVNLTATGKVGIGTTNPAYKLTLEDTGHNYLGITGGNQHIAGVLFGDTSNKSIGRIYYNNADNSMTFRTNGTDRVTIKSTGHTYVSGSVRSTHQVRASGWFTGDTAGHGPAAEIGISGDFGYLMNFDRSNSSYGTIIVQSRYGRARFDNDGVIRIGNHSDGTKQLHMLSQTGLFGVGKTPSYKLDVGGDINYTGKLMKNGSEQETSDKSNFVRKEGLGTASYYSADTWIEFRDTNAGLYWGGSQSTAGWHVFPNNANDLRLRSAQSGEVGIQLETSNLSTRGYVYANSNNEIGFLNKDRSWNFRLTGQKVTLGGPDTEWNLIHAVNGPNAIHFNRHERFWIGAGNGTWFTGSANSKSQASGFNATYAHDLLITTMNSTSTYDRGITFAVATNDDKNAGYRLGKWHSGDAKDSSKLVVDGQIFAKAGNTDEYDYYGNNYSSYHSYQGGTAGWSGDSGYGWHVPGVVSSSAIQIQSGNASTNSRKPQLQFHQHGYGGPAIQYDGPGKNLDIIAPTTRLSNSTGLRFRGQTVWHAGNDGSGSGLDADKLDGVHLSSLVRNDTDLTINKSGTWNIQNNGTDWAIRVGNSNGSNSYVYMADDKNGMHIRNDSSTTSNYLLDVYAANGNRFRVRGADGLTTIGDYEVIHTGNISSHVPTDVVRTTYNSSLNTDTRNSRGVTRLYRRDSNSDYSVQTDWTTKNNFNTHGSTHFWRLQGYVGDSFHAGVQVHHALDADKLDGISSGSFVRSDASDTMSGDYTFTGGAGAITITNSDIRSNATSTWTGNPGSQGKIQYHSNRWYIVADSASNRICQFRRDGSDKSYIDNNGKYIGDTDKLDGLHASSFLRSGSSTQTIRGGQVYSSDWFRNTASATGLYNTVNDAHFYSAGDNYWHINGNSSNITHGGLVFYDRYNSTQGNATGRKGYVYWSPDGFGLLDNDGAWAVRIQTGTSPLELRCDNNVELEVHTSYVKANGSFRAPEFYVDGNIYHNGDTNTYVGFHANDQFRVVCAGSEQMEWGSGYTLLNDNKTLRFGSSSDFRQWFDGSHMYFRNYAHSGGNIYFQGEDPNGTNRGLLYMYNDTAGNSHLRLYHNGSDRMRTSATGIDVYGGTGTEGGQVNLKYNSGHANHVSIDVIRNTGQYDGTTSDWYWRVFNDTISPVYQMLFNTRTGDFEVSGDVISFGDSDIKLKDNLQLIQNPVDKIKQLNGYTFTWNDESTKSGKHDIGVVAQEVEAVFPELVKTKLTGHKGVSYEKLTAVLIAGVNQQQEQIEQQQKQIDQLSEQIKQLIDRIEK